MNVQLTYRFVIGDKITIKQGDKEAKDFALSNPHAYVYIFAHEELIDEDQADAIFNCYES